MGGITRFQVYAVVQARAASVSVRFAAYNFIQMTKTKMQKLQQFQVTLKDFRVHDGPQTELRRNNLYKAKTACMLIAEIVNYFAERKLYRRRHECYQLVDL